MISTRSFLTSVCMVTALVRLAGGAAIGGDMTPVVITADGKGFALQASGERFTPWGFNYARPGKLLEDFWETDWPGVEQDFREMHELGANVVRVHLQVGAFMQTADCPREAALARLANLLKLAEQTGLYLDITGLACYRKADVPPWYDALDDRHRWAAQTVFWEAVAKRCAGSPAVFCYDLMNEPISSGPRKVADWYSGKTLGGFDFVQFIALNPEGRPREDMAVAWIKTLKAAIRKQDQRTPITVGLLPWSPKWKWLSGFTPERVAPELDFLSPHIYPEAGKMDEALDGLKKFAVGKPVVIEETFPLHCGTKELKSFLKQSRGTACGWIGHYDGRPLAELEQRRQAHTISMQDAMMMEWLKLFQQLAAEMKQ